MEAMSKRKRGGSHDRDIPEQVAAASELQQQSNGTDPPSKLCSRCLSLCSCSSQASTLSIDFHDIKTLVNRSAAECHLCYLLSRSLSRDTIIEHQRQQLLLEARHSYYGEIAFALLSDTLEDKVLAEAVFQPQSVQYVDSISHLQSTDTQSSESWAKILRWIQLCDEKHVRCHRKTQMSQQWPARILEVGKPGDLTVRIRETSQMDLSQLKYMTLSHRWGENKPTILTKDCYALFLGGITMASLPKTFREAIEVTRRLGQSHLWIDSLCIVQDSHEDWGVESVKMYQIYRNSYLNLVAGAAYDANGGLFSERNPLSVVPCVLATDSGNSVSSYSSELEVLPDSLRRGWIHQELVAASRVVLFGTSEICWSCCDLNATETFPEPQEEIFVTQTKATREAWQELEGKSSDWRLDSWDILISDYSATRLSYYHDRLPAVAGLASELQKSWADVHYLAGMWSYRLRQSLLWRANAQTDWESKRLPDPSWSWASNDGPVEWPANTRRSDSLAEIIEVRMEQSEEKNSAIYPYGPVKSGSIRLKGPIAPVTVTRLVGDSWSMIFRDIGDGDSRDGLNDEGHHSMITWDTKEDRDTLTVAFAWIAPLDVFVSENSLSLQGLILWPTGSVAGGFRRAGFFEVFMHQEVLQDQPSDQEVIEYYVRSTQGEEDDDSDTSLAWHPQNGTVKEVRDLFARAGGNMTSECTPSANSQRTDTTRECFLKLQEKLLSQGYDEQDTLFCNLPSYYTLRERYIDGLPQDDPPEITSFMSAMLAKIEKAREDGKLSRSPYGEYHGDGMFTYDLV